METKRPPALTSPWKIGFLVSLLLILLGVGINYILFRTFNLTWKCLGYDQGNWFFHKEMFLNEMFPMVAIIVLASLIAYFSITAAVRRYKAYLDSGHDYRNLIQSIEEVNDLEDENVVQGLNKYPPLRDFLTRMRDQLHEREKALANREKKLAKQGRKEGASDELKKECDALTQAIKDIQTGKLSSELPITIPELQPVAEALQVVAGSGGSPLGAEDKRKLLEIQKEIDEAGTYLKGRLAESQGELQASCATAQEVERQLSELDAKLDNQTGTTAEGTGAVDLAPVCQTLDMIERLSETLSDLGEEAKGVAINTALQAGSGEGAMADLIQLAEEVRRVAVKFTDVSRSYEEAVEQLRTSVMSIQAEFTEPDGIRGGDSEIAAVISALKSKVSLWVERIIILADQLKNIEDSYDLSLAPIVDKIAPSAEPTDESRQGDLVIGPTFQEQAQVEKLDDDSQVSELEVETNASDAFGEKKSSSSIFSEIDSSAQDIPGLEKNQGQIFSERGEEESMFDQLGKGGKLEGESAVEDQEAAFEELPPAKKSAPQDALSVDEKLEVEKAQDIPEQVNRLDPSTGDAEEEEVIDLYALGAVDYE